MPNSTGPASEARQAQAVPDRLLQSAAAALSPGIRRSIKKMGLLPTDKRGRIVWPGDGTLIAAWRHCEDIVIREPTAEEFLRYRLLKARLKATSLEPSGTVVRLLQRFAGDRPITTEFGRELLGRSCVQSAIAAAGLPGRRRVAGRTAKPAGLEDFLALLPSKCRRRLASQLEREVLPPVLPPSQARMGRVLALRGEACRIMAATALLLVSAERKSDGMAQLYLNIAERLDGLVESHLQRSEAAVSAAMDECVSGAPSRATIFSLYHYAGMLKQIEKFLVHVLGDDAEAVSTLLPAQHLKASLFRNRVGRLLSEYAQKAQVSKGKRIAGMFEAVDQILFACDNRVAQLEAIFLAIGRARSDPDRTLHGSLSRIDCVVPVLRPDGSLGVGKQIVRFKVERADDLIMLAARCTPNDLATRELARYHRACTTKAGIAAAEESLVYLDSRPVVEGGECHEPFFVAMYRVGLFDDGIGLTTERMERRARMLREAGLPLTVGCEDGFLRYGRRQRTVVRALRRALRDGAPVIVPITGLLHAMSVAHVIVRMGIRWGARVGATRQLRMGCFSSEVLNGRARIVAELRLKGRKSTERCEIDPETIERIRRITRLAHTRWFGDVFDGGRPSLPEVPFRDHTQPLIPEARYILVGPNGTLNEKSLAVFVRIILIGIVAATSHDFRHLFATALGFAGEHRRAIAASLDHTPGSSSTPKYDSSDLVRSRRAARNVLSGNLSEASGPSR